MFLVNSLSSGSLRSGTLLLSSGRASSHGHIKRPSDAGSRRCDRGSDSRRRLLLLLLADASGEIRSFFNFHRVIFVFMGFFGDVQLFAFVFGRVWQSLGVRDLGGDRDVARMWVTVVIIIFAVIPVEYSRGRGKSKNSRKRREAEDLVT